jgi:ferric-dicitrate binding protein FerR (iron transport regulator)
MIYADDVIETDGAARAGLRAADGSSVRLDTGSRVRLLAPAVVELIEGAVYIATSQGSPGFEVRTSMGAVRDIGTQFEVRLDHASLRLRVRAGAAELRRNGRVTSAAAGTEATVTPDGVATRHVPTYGSDWEWTARLAASFPIEGRPLRAFLEQVAGEEGWRLKYADPALGDAASRIVLHGSVEGLRTEEALGVALTTSGLQYRLREGELLVSRPAIAH